MTAKNYLRIGVVLYISLMFAVKCAAQDFTASFDHKGIVNKLHKVDSAKAAYTTFNFYNGNPLTASVVSGKDSVLFFVTEPKQIFFKDADMRIDVYPGYFTAADDEYAGALFVQFEKGEITIIYILLTNKQFIFYNGKD